MGLLIDVTHEQRVRDPEHAARLFRALGIERCSLDGLAPASPEELDRVLDAARDDSQITFEADPLDDEALAALDALVVAVDGYLHLDTGIASLRVWPHQTWMHGYERLPDETVSAILDKPVTLAAGTTTIDDVELSLPGCSGHVPFDVRTARTAVATRMFRALYDGKPARGYCTELGGRTREPLRRFLHRLHARLEAAVVVDLVTAVALSRHVRSEDLTWDGPVRVTFPGGEITTYFVGRAVIEGEPVWRARITDALVRAG